MTRWPDDPKGTSALVFANLSGTEERSNTFSLDERTGAGSIPRSAIGSATRWRTTPEVPVGPADQRPAAARQRRLRPARALPGPATGARVGALSLPRGVDHRSPGTQERGAGDSGGGLARPGRVEPATDPGLVVKLPMEHAAEADLAEQEGLTEKEARRADLFWAAGIVAAFLFLFVFLNASRGTAIPCSWRWRSPMPRPRRRRPGGQALLAHRRGVVGLPGHRALLGGLPGLPGPGDRRRGLEDPEFLRPSPRRPSRGWSRRSA